MPIFDVYPVFGRAGSLVRFAGSGTFTVHDVDTDALLPVTQGGGAASSTVAADSDGRVEFDTGTDGAMRVMLRDSRARGIATVVTSTEGYVSQQVLDNIDAETAAQINDPTSEAHAALVAAAGDVYDPATAGLFDTATATRNKTDARYGSKSTQDANTSAIAGKVDKGALSINARDYGALGNNIADDTTAIRNAIAAAASSKRELIIPGGHYKITGTLDLPDGLVMRGSGLDPVNGTPTRLNFSTLTGATPAITIIDGSNITVTDLYITGRATGSGNELQFTGNSRAISIERVTINTSTTGAAVSLASAGGATSVIKSEFTNVSTVGGTYGFWVGPSCTSLHFSTCYTMLSTTAGYLVQGTYLAFTACAADQNALYAYLIQNAVAVSFDGCGSEQTTRTGWHLVNSKQITLVGCRSVNNNTSAHALAPSFLGINDGSDFVTAIGCVDTTPNAATARSVSSWNGTAPTAVTLTNCDFTAKGINANVPTVHLAAVTGTTAPAAGGAGALPATPLGYATVSINGAPRKIAYY